MIKNVRWEKLNDQQTNHLIQQNLWNNHEEDLKAIQQGGKGNNLLGSPPQRLVPMHIFSFLVACHVCIQCEKEHVKCCHVKVI